MLTENNPESGTTTYRYDVNPSNGAYNSAGDLVQKVDAAGNVSNYIYDALHRLHDAGVQPWGLYSGKQANPVCRRFRYDVESNSALPPGVTVQNTLGRMEYAGTDDCGKAGNGQWNPISREWLSYADNGQMTDLYESTPNSGGFLHTTASYYENGAPNTLSGVPGLAQAWTYGLDGAARPSTVSDNSGQVVTGITYNAAGQPLTVNFFSGSDTFTYDAAMRMHTFTYNVAGQSYSGTVNWNQNGTLGSLNVNDPFFSTTENCTYTYDDLARQAGVNCTNGSTNVSNQAFSYDVGLSTGAFGNLSKSGTGSFSVTYNNNNHIVGFGYDANGNVTTDSASNTYTWDPNWSVLTNFNNSDPMTYDAFGRMVEVNGKPILYSPLGKIGRLNTGGSYIYAAIPTAAGRLDYITTSTYARVEHPDWLGSSRFMSNPHLNTAVGAVAYAPFGESYNKTSAMRLNFTDQFQDSQITDTYDFEVRKLSDIQGRWLSPDPAGLAAVDLTNPQTWNRYAYVANAPLTAIDPLGLVTLPPGEGGGGGGGCFFELPGELRFPGWDPIIPPGPIVPPDDPRGGGGGGGHRPPGGGGNGAPTPVPGGNPSGIGSGENLGIPSGIPFPEFNILDALGLNPTPGCDFGVCSPVGDPFQSGAEAIGAGACLANPICATIAVTTTVAVIGYYYGPHIIRFAKGGASQNPLPSWVTDRPRPGETAEGFATRVCKAQYPPDGAGCGKGAGSEFNKIKKWAQEWINKHG